MRGRFIMSKVKFVELVQEVAGEAMIEAIKTAKPKYKDLTNEELAEMFGLSEFQFNHLTEKAVGRAVSEKLEEKMEATFVAGSSIEFPRQFNVFIHESQVRKNTDGTPSRKLSIRTRKALKDKLNG